LCETMLKPTQGGQGSLSLEEINEVRAAFEETIGEVEAITSQAGWTATHLHDRAPEPIHDGPRDPSIDPPALPLSDLISAGDVPADGERHLILMPTIPTPSAQAPAPAQRKSVSRTRSYWTGTLRPNRASGKALLGAMAVTCAAV